MEENKMYEKPSIIVIPVESCDIITYSPGSDNEGNIPDGW